MEPKTVEAIHVEQTIYESDLHFSHSMSTKIDRLLIDLSGGRESGPWLVVYFWEGVLGAYILENSVELTKANFKRIKEVQIPESLFFAGLEVANFQKRIKSEGLESQFGKIVAEKTP